MNRVRFPMDDDADNIEDLKTHGYIFSDSDSESSSDNDTNDSTIVSNRNCNRARPNLKASLLIDSAQNSDLSDFDDAYYAVQPPAVPLNEFKGVIVKIKAKKVWENKSEASRYHTQLCSKSTNSKNVYEVGPAFGIPKNNKQQQIINTQTPLKNVWCTTNDFNNCLKTQLPDKKIRIGDTRCSLANNSIEEFLSHPNESIYLKEFPPLPQRKRNRINQSTSNNTEFSDVSNVRNNFDDYLQEFTSVAELANNVTERSATPILPIHTDQLFRCRSNTLNTKKIGCCLQEFPSLPQPNESEGVGVNPSSVRGFNKGLYLSEVLKRVNGFTFSQELTSPPELNRNRRLSNSSSSSVDTADNITFPNALRTTIIGNTQADLCYSEVSKGVNELTYSEELPILSELNKSRLSSSTLSTDTIENIALLPNACHTTLIGDTQEDLCYSEVSKGVNELTYSEELPILSELNKSRLSSSTSTSSSTLSIDTIARLPTALHTTLVGDTQEDLCYSEVSKGVNELTYSEELPILSELNKSRLSSSTLSIDTIARLPTALHTTLVGDTQEDLCYSEVSKGVNELTYSEELPILSELNKSRLSSSTLSIDTIARLPTALHTTLIGDTQEDLCYSEVSKGVNDLNYSEELSSLPELNKNRRLSLSTLTTDTTENIARLTNAFHRTLIGDTQEDLCYSEVSNGVNDLTYSEELSSLPELNKNRRLSLSTLSVDITEKIAHLPNALHTTLIGGTREDLCYSEASKGVNDLTYLEELPALPEIININRRLSNASTSPMDATENMSCLPDISHTTSLMSSIDCFFTFLENTENKNLHDKSILLLNYLSEENGTNTPLSTVEKIIERLDRSNQESAWVTEESTSVMEHSKTGTIHPAKDIWNILPHIHKKCLAFSEPAANLKQEIINFQVNQGADPENCAPKLKKHSKKKNKLKVKETECFSEFTKLNSNNNTHDLVCQKLIKDEIKKERLAPTSTKIKTRQSKNIQKGKKAEFKEHGITKTDSLKLATEVTLNKNHGMGPKNTIIDCCDTKALLSNNVHISHRNVPYRLVRNNNATRTRVRLAGERRRRRLYAQLYHMSDDDLAKRAFAKGIILLLVIIYAYYSVKSFLNLYLRIIFGICDNGLNKVLCY